MFSWWNSSGAAKEDKSQVVEQNEAAQELAKEAQRAQTEQKTEGGWLSGVFSWIAGSATAQDAEVKREEIEPLSVRKAAVIEKLEKYINPERREQQIAARQKSGQIAPAPRKAAVGEEPRGGGIGEVDTTSQGFEANQGAIAGKFGATVQRRRQEASEKVNAI